MILKSWRDSWYWKSSQEEERKQLLTLMSQKTRGAPRKSGNCPRRSHLAVDLKRLLPARAVAPRKRTSSESYPRKVRMDIFLVGHNLQRYSPSHPLEPNKNKNKFKKNRTGHGTTDWFQIEKGVHQGYILSPCLFNLYVEKRWAGWSTSWNQDFWEKYQ